MLRHAPRPCCPPPPHPEPVRIPAGLATLPRQATAFPHYRRAMLHAVEAYPALSGWTADSAHDLGVMLLEAWSYVLDITGFYDRMIAERSYLGTANDDAIAAEIVALTGYRPRPAMVARVRLALEARGRDPVLVPAATGFRSQPFGDEKAQVFELLEPVKIWPQRNRWPLAPHRLASFDGTLRFAASEGPVKDAVVSVTSGTLRHAARVVASDVGPAADGERYRTITLDPPLPGSFTGQLLSAIKVNTLALLAHPSPHDGAGAWGSTGLYLDALYPMLLKGQDAAIEVNGVLHAVSLTSAGVHNHVLSVGSSGATATLPLSYLTFASVGTVGSDAVVRAHLAPKSAGTLLRPAETRVTSAMIQAQGALALPGVELDGAPASGPAFALGQRAAGLDLPGTVQPGMHPRYVPDAGAAGPDPLETPIAILGNVVTAIRGETVSNEVLGSGNAQIAAQRFPLKKKPLSWIEDAAAASGRVPQITLWVDGLAWAFTDSFYGRKSGDRLFAIEMAPDGTATIIGGDGERGMRFPSGVRNIVASYRAGAGAAKPPPGSIGQFARAAAGLSRVTQPLAAWGGADAEKADEIRALAPAGALTLGRAVSLADFEAMIRGSSGIVNASVAYSWDQGRQAAIVVGWIIADSGDPSETLAAYLAARAAPGLAIQIQLAEKLALPMFDVAVVQAAGYAAGPVRAAVQAALFDAKTGRLAPANVPVGAPIFRSQLLATIHAIPGVGSVPSIALAAGPMPKALSPGAGRWFDFLAHGRVV
ncbi:hypothetical protein AB2M62_01360 [Sphingomonas sp. MMS12-HWE2-04]|uniref:hypothetical protein n=1 Tax=Sphingomonas sp. MMS12-HWE2-04 TaxID=3234199 RepID=UPI00384FAAEF